MARKSSFFLWHNITETSGTTTPKYQWYKDAEKITLIMDNLATHKASALYETYTPKEAKRIWDRFDRGVNEKKQDEKNSN